MNLRKLTVSEINEYVKKLLDYDPILQNVIIKGELSNFVAHSSGHAYFSLKDDSSKINCIMFKRFFKHTKVDFKDGQLVNCKGKVSLFKRDGKFQLYVNEIELSGKGKLYEKFKKMKKEYEKKGYFDKKNKKEIPKYPSKIGCITSHQGAALQDIKSVFNRRTTLVDMDVYSVNVQGEYSKKEIVKAIKYFNKSNVDLIILSRGGGSIEELWSFNEPEVVEAIFDSKLPVISGVGHESDFTLTDYVADLRAPTPSSAAEVAISSNVEVKLILDKLKSKLNDNMKYKINIIKEKLNNLSIDSLILKKENQIKQNFNKIDNLNLRLNQLMDKKITKSNEKLKSLLLKLNHNNPINILDKGYSITKNKNGEIINSSKMVNNGDEVITKLSKGSIISKVSEVKNG
ncbi:MAG: exodeoxyribonuclease VII large subunit [Bacillota bacterium]